MALPIMIDCDPGHDDAIALVLALASPELEVKAVTASAGNQTPENPAQRAAYADPAEPRRIFRSPAARGKPLMRDLIIADNVHGESGLDGPNLPGAGLFPAELHRRRADGENAAGKPGPVTLVATGPQTNVALLLASHPELHVKIARIVIMGRHGAGQLAAGGGV